MVTKIVALVLALAQGLGIVLGLGSDLTLVHTDGTIESKSSLWKRFDLNGFTGWLIALLAIEVVSIIVIRHLGMTILNKFWLESYLNRALKKLADLLLSSLVLLTAFPVIYLLTAVYTRCSKGFAHGSILRFKRMHTQAGSFSALLFNECGAITDQPLINRTPIFFNVLIGDLSLWDIMTLQRNHKNKRVRLQNSPTRIRQRLIFILKMILATIQKSHQQKQIITPKYNEYI